MMRLIPLFLLLMWPSARAEILRVEIEGVIDPITSEFISTSVAEAEASQAEFLLIRLATPGGLGISMQEIIQTILNSKVPIVCYVSPKGAHAASAGFFILLAADVAAMSPGTNTGAAHPVFPFGMENKIMLEKVKNDALASLRSIVNQRKRNYDLAEKGVLESKSYTAAEAVEGGLIDLIANSEEELLEALQGREVTRFTGETQVLETRNNPIRTLEMTFRQRVLSEIADPNFSLILGVIGVLGLYIEFTHPGMILPGIVGGICLLLALLGFSLLPVNIIGVLLVFLAIGLFVAEVKVQGFGVLGIGGIVSMILGFIFLIDSPYPEMRVDLGVALALAVPFAVIFIFLLRLVIKSHMSRVSTGEAGMVGAYGIARDDIGPEGGRVLVNGEFWKAFSEQAFPAGTKVRVTRMRHLEVWVEAADEPFEQK